MAARGAYGFRLGDGLLKVGYCHNDASPNVLGRHVFEYALSHTVDELRNTAMYIRVVSDDIPPTRSEINRYLHYADCRVGKGTLQSWYCLLRGVQGRIDGFDEGVGHLVDGSKLFADPMWCSWAYVIDVNEHVLDVYQGQRLGKKQVSTISEIKGVAMPVQLEMKRIDRVPLGKGTQESVDDVVARWERRAEGE